MFAIEGHFTLLASISKYSFVPALVVVPKQFAELIGNQVNSWKAQLVEIAICIALGSAQLALSEYKPRLFCQTFSILLLTSVAVSARNHTFSLYIQAILVSFSIIIAIGPSWPLALTFIPFSACASGLPGFYKNQHPDLQIDAQYLGKKRVSFSNELPVDSVPVNITKNISAAEALFAKRRALSNQLSSESSIQDCALVETEAVEAFSSGRKLSTDEFKTRGPRASIPSEQTSDNEWEQNMPNVNDFSPGQTAKACVIPEGESLATGTSDSVIEISISKSTSIYQSKAGKPSKLHQPIALSVNFDNKH